MGNVYFVRCGPAVKVGFAANVAKRVGQLQVGAAYELELLAVLPDATRSMEAMWHGVLSSLHMRGEWFTDCQAMRFITECITAGARPRTLEHMTVLWELANSKEAKAEEYRAAKPIVMVAPERQEVRLPTVGLPIECALIAAKADRILMSAASTKDALRWAHIHKRHALNGTLVSHLPSLDSFLEI